MSTPSEIRAAPRRPSRNAIYTFIGCFLALALGAAAGSLQRKVPATRTTLASPSTPQPVPSREGPLPAAETQLDPSFAEEIRTASGAKRWLLLLSAAEQATAADMPAMIRSVGTDAAAVRMLAARWAELDPKHMFSYLYGDSFTPDDAPGALPNRWVLTEVLLTEWTKRDLAGAIKALNDAPAFPSRESFRMQIANQAIKTDVEKGLQMMSEWGIRNYIPDLKGVSDWAAREPQRAAESVLKYTSDYAGQEALRMVGRAWGNSDPEGGLRFAATLEPGARATLGTELIREWAKKNVKGAADFAASQDDLGFRGALAKGLVETWGQTDPAAALAWSEEHLRGTARDRSDRWIDHRSRTKKSDDRVRTRRRHAARFGAKSRVRLDLRNLVQKRSEGTGRPPSNGSLRCPMRRRAGSLLNACSGTGCGKILRACVNSSTGPHGSLASSSMIQQVARQQAAKNPEEAMRWAAQFPAERATQAREAVLTSWLSIRPEAASDYVRNLPAGTERESAIRTVSQSLMWQSIEQTGAWYRSLPTADRRIAREVFDRSGLNEEKRRQLDAALGGA